MSGVNALSKRGLAHGRRHSLTDKLRPYAFNPRDRSSGKARVLFLTARISTPFQNQIRIGFRKIQIPLVVLGLGVISGAIWVAIIAWLIASEVIATIVDLL
jgi:hypothetical protein